MHKIYMHIAKAMASTAEFFADARDEAKRAARRKLFSKNVKAEQAANKEIGELHSNITKYNERIVALNNAISSTQDEITYAEVEYNNQVNAHLASEAEFEDVLDRI